MHLVMLKQLQELSKKKAQCLQLMQQVVSLLVFKLLKTTEAETLQQTLSLLDLVFHTK